MKKPTYSPAKDTVGLKFKVSPTAAADRKASKDYVKQYPGLSWDPDKACADAIEKCLKEGRQMIESIIEKEGLAKKNPPPIPDTLFPEPKQFNS